MKKIAFVLITVLTLLALCLTVCAQNEPLNAAESSDEQTLEQSEQPHLGKDYASDKTFAETLQEWVFANWEKITVAAYIIYKLCPVIGGIAKSKKSTNALKTTLDAYFGDEKSEKNVFAMQKAAAQAQTKFMNEAYDVLDQAAKAVSPIAQFIEQSKNSEKARAATVELALACQSSVNLMATQLNDLVLASPSIGQKKKAEIEEAWIKKEKEINDLVQKVVTSCDVENQM